MGLGKLGQTLTAREIFNLVKKDLDRVEREITLESVAIVDAVTTAHGGNVSMTSEPGQTRFVITLPLQGTPRS